MITKHLNAQMSILLRFDSDEYIGAGHMVRCFALGEEFKSENIDVIYATKHRHKKVENIFAQRGLCHLSIPKNFDWMEEAEYLTENISNKNTTVLFDITNSYTLNNPEDVSAYIEYLRSYFPVVVIDSYAGQSLCDKVSACFDMVIIPYCGVGISSSTKSHNTIYLTGAKYFIFQSDYERLSPLSRAIRKDACRVLLSFGGSDPQGLTLDVLSAIAEITNRVLEIRIVTGLNFKPDLIHRLHQQIRSFIHHCKIITAPCSLAEHMLWCDLAVTSSGLTKYELAVTGTPSIQISIDEQHAMVNKAFEKEGTAVHLGVCSQIDKKLIKDAIVHLLGDFENRSMMSERGRNLCDIFGKKRIVNEIRRLIHAE